MNAPALLSAALTGALLLAAAPPTHAPPDDPVPARSASLTWADGVASGPGWEGLVALAREARFVAVGEQHGLAQVPALVAALRAAAGRPGAPLHLALENGALGMDQARQALDAGGRPALDRLLRAHPMTLAFATREDLDLIEAAAAAGVATWGFDQESGAGALLDAALGDDARWRPLVEAVVEREAGRRRGLPPPHCSWLVQPDGAAPLGELLAADLPPARRSDLRRLRASRQIYAELLAGRPVRSNDLREGLMVDQFDAGRAALASATEPAPRVLLRAGAAHLSRLGNDAHQPSLGNHLVGLARREGATSLHLLVVADARDGGPLSVSARLPSTARLLTGRADTGWTVVFTEALREDALQGRLGPLDAWLTRALFGYDVLVVIDAPSPADDWLSGAAPP